MKIGLLGLWGYRGAGHLNRTLYQALTELGHECHVFARTGYVYGMAFQESTGDWAVPHLRLHPRYDVEPGIIRSWAQYEQLDAVLFSEEYEFSLPYALQQVGIKTMAYMDFLSASQRPLLKFYDLMLCSTMRTYRLLAEDWHKEATTQYMGWGVPPALMGAGVGAWPRVDFFSNQGFLGINGRKGLDTLLAAIQLMEDDPPEVLIHSQIPEEACRQVVGWTGGLPAHIVWEDRTIPPPGLYSMGRVVVQPSKLEGLGLTLVEALCAGRPVITVDAPPMNELVNDACGWLVPVDRYTPREDGILFPEAIITPDALCKVMQEARASSDEVMRAKGSAALAHARALCDWSLFKARIAAGLERIGVI